VAVPGAPELRILNAGSSTILGQARILAHRDGAIAWEGWLSAARVEPRSWSPPPRRTPAGAAATA
jgi:hypothetical protein